MRAQERQIWLRDLDQIANKNSYHLHPPPLLLPSPHISISPRHNGTQTRARSGSQLLEVIIYQLCLLARWNEDGWSSYRTQFSAFTRWCCDGGEGRKWRGSVPRVCCRGSGWFVYFNIKAPHKPTIHLRFRNRWFPFQVSTSPVRKCRAIRARQELQSFLARRVQHTLRVTYEPSAAGFLLSDSTGHREKKTSLDGATAGSRQPPHDL